MFKRLAIFAVLSILAVLPAVAASAPGIQRGIDTWVTVPEGTFADFQNNPLPAGFFCQEFEGYTGQIFLKGVPLASDRPGVLGSTDTIVERLDNAVFNKRGVAQTRVRVRALQLEGIEDFKTVCGDYKVRVTLDGEQPISTMRIFRDNARGGRFSVPLAVNTKIIFTRLDNEAEQLEFSDPVRFPDNPYNHWAFRNLVRDAKRVGRVTVDTDWDGTPDALLPGTSNFYPAANRLKAAMHAGHLVAAQ
jgi:hypothetical protein